MASANLFETASQSPVSGPRRQQSTATGSAYSDQRSDSHHNVGSGERIVSVAAGSILALLGLRRHDAAGLLIAGIGGGLLFRGATGHCSVYEKLGVDTKNGANAGNERLATPKTSGVKIAEAFLIDKTPQDLYEFWRNLENLPRIMTHLKSVKVLDERRSRWVATAPRLAGGEIGWDAEITADELNKRIAWQSLAGSPVEHQGSIEFTQALGNRGSLVRVMMEYRSPGGQLGNIVAKLFGESPDQQIREDLRNFKRTMELGEVLSIDGQPRGTCVGRGKRQQESMS